MEQLARRAHLREYGHLPPDLETLAATMDEVWEVPIDPYSGEPMRYDPERGLLWSVGRDRVDDGAADRTERVPFDWTKIPDDLAFPITVASP